ncbi:hypothetical protein DFJ74DRAFT_754484 [Hyaloraphidium curvatum]|nr:hypothetical protein DFJ74DRAFT_754484 [Hyaloraphidium curvatum]
MLSTTTGDAAQDALIRVAYSRAYGTSARVSTRSWRISTQERLDLLVRGAEGLGREDELGRRELHVPERFPLQVRLESGSAVPVKRQVEVAVLRTVVVGAGREGFEHVSEEKPAVVGDAVRQRVAADSLNDGADPLVHVGEPEIAAQTKTKLPWTTNLDIIRVSHPQRATWIGHGLVLLLLRHLRSSVHQHHPGQDQRRSDPPKQRQRVVEYHLGKQRRADKVGTRVDQARVHRRRRAVERAGELEPHEDVAEDH